MKTNMSAIELSAIDYYMKAHNYRLVLSILPNVTFRNKRTDEKIDVNMRIIVDEYNSQKEEDKKQAAQAKRQIENENKWKRKY